MATHPQGGEYFELDAYYVTLDFLRWEVEPSTVQDKAFRYTPTVKFIDSKTDQMLCLFELMPVLDPKKAAESFYREHLKTCRISRPSSFIYYVESPNTSPDEEFYIEL